MTKGKLAYLSSEYPAISHTFIFREIEALREMGFEIHTASIRPASNVDKMTEAERREAGSTFCIQTSGPMHIAKAVFSSLLRKPLGFFKSFGVAMQSGWRCSKLLKALFYWGEALVLVDWAMQRDIKHIHVHFANPAATVALIAKAYGCVDYSLSVHGPDVFDNIGQNLLREKLDGAVFVRSISHFCKSQLFRWMEHGSWAKVHVIRTGVDVDKFSTRPEPRNAVAEMLCVGRLVPAKGQHVLLQACAKLKEKKVPFKLNIVGGGPDERALKDLCRDLGLEDLVAFTGPLGQDLVHSYYDRADVFVLPSFAEGVPVVLMESMAKGIPTISTRITGIPELIEDRETGFLLSPSDTDSLADCLSCALLDLGKLSSMGKKGRQKVLESYNLGENCRKLGLLFEAYLR